MSDPKTDKPETDQPEMDVYSGVRWSALSKYGAQGMQVVVSLVLARLLAPEYFGLLGMATVVTGFVKVFQNLGFNSAIIQRKQVGDALLSTLFWVNLGVCLLVAGVLVAISPAAAWIYSDARVTPIVAVLALNFVFAGFTMIPTAVLTRRMAFNKLAVREIAAAIFGGATALTLAALGFGVWSLVAGSLVGSATQMILINLLSPFRPRLVFDRQGLRECLGFGLNLTGFNVFNYFSRNADHLIIGIFLGPIALGYYALAYKFMLLPRESVTGVLTRVLFPAFSRMQDDDERLANAYLRVCGAIAFITFPMMAGMAVVARPFVEVVLGDKWLPAIPIVSVLALLGMLQSVTATTGNIFLAKGKPSWMFGIAVAGGTVHTCGFLVGVYWGAIGVAVAYCVTSLVMQIPHFLLVFKLVPSLTWCRLLNALKPYAVCSGAMAVVVLLCRMSSENIGLPRIATLTVCICVGATFYASVILHSQPPALRSVAKLISHKRLPILHRENSGRAE